MRRLPIVTVLLCTATSGWCQNPVCDPAQFKDAVAVVSAAINAANAMNGKALQEKLQKWRIATGLNETDFATKAAPIIRDAVTASIDADNQALIAKVRSLGTNVSHPSRCEAMVSELKVLMGKISANTTARWSHMMANVTSATSAPIHAGAAR